VQLSQDPSGQYIDVVRRPGEDEDVDFTAEAKALCGGLSPRQVEILQISCKGLNSRDCAALLHISPQTVDGHRAELFRKLEVNTMVEAAVLAAKAGLA
jgi:DNA-binding NarL/FixJ family response regulator